ncbi:MAG: hypothetical protein JWO03_2849 [Bacteroidetes bacterium]|nr:hypothetical protein [Bacteroidota bacterium]
MRQFYIAVILLFAFSSATNAQDTTAAIADTSCHCVKITPPAKTFNNAHLYSTLSPFLSENYYTNEIQLDFDFHVNSNALMTTFAGAFLTGKEITDQMKGRVVNYAPKLIKYEDEMKAGLSYKHYFKKPSVTLYVSYYHRNMRFLTTSRDGFELIFYGNKRFEDKTADLSNIHFENLMYNQYSVGISKSDGHFFGGINLSFLQGFNDQQLTNSKGSLYTAPYGEYLDVAYNLSFNQANNGASKFFDLDGKGFSADLQLGYNTDKFRISFTVQDLGLITWKGKTTNYTGDTALRYNGIVINDLTNLAGSGLAGLKLDSVFGVLGPKKTNKAYATNLPTTFQLNYSQLIKLKKHDMILTASISTRLLQNYYAYGYVKAAFLLDHSWTTSVSAGAGGYSLFNLGMDVGKRWRNLDFIIGSNNLIGSLLPMYFPGSSGYFRVTAHF